MRSYRARRKADALGVPVETIRPEVKPVNSHRCSICDDPPRLAFVKRLRAEGVSVYKIRERSREPEALELGVTPMKEATIKRHLTICPGEIAKAEARHIVEGIRVTRDKDGNAVLTTRPPRLVEPRVEDTVEAHAERAMERFDSLPHTASSDLAVAMRDAVKEKLDAGELRLTAQHGLMAQQMIDRRIEKQRDRELAVRLGVMLTAKAPPADVLPARNVTPTPFTIDTDDYEEIGQ